MKEQRVIKMPVNLINNTYFVVKGDAVRGTVLYLLVGPDD